MKASAAKTDALPAFLPKSYYTIFALLFQTTTH